MVAIPKKDTCVPNHDRDGGCYMCCNACNYNNHICHSCGTGLYHDSYEDALKTRRHYLSDCRPDIIDGSYYRERGLPIEIHTDGPMVYNPLI